MSYLDILQGFNVEYPELYNTSKFLNSKIVYLDDMNVLWEYICDLYKGNIELLSGSFRKNIIGAFESLVMFHEEDKKNHPEQDITPNYISELLVRLVEVKDNHKIGDLWCRTGELLLKATKGKKNIETIGWSIKLNELTFWRMKIAEVNNFNVRHEYILSKSEGESENDFDILLSNTPFSLPFKRNNIDNDLFRYGEPQEKFSDLLFITKALLMLNKTGKAAFIISSSALNRVGKEKNIREGLSRTGFVKQIIELPKKIFLGTSVSSAIIVLDKDNKSDFIKMIDATQTTNNKRYSFGEDSIKWILARTVSEKMDNKVANVTLNMLEEMDFSWVPNKYLTKDEIIYDINEVEREVIQLESKLKFLGGKYRDLQIITGAEL